MSTRVAPYQELYSYRTTQRDPVVTFTGSEFFAAFTVSGVSPITAAGQVVVNRLMNPSTFTPNSRIVNMARNYEEFRFVKAKMIYVPTVADTVDGGLMHAYFADPTVDLNSNVLSTMLATGGSKGPLRASCVVDAKLDKEWFKVNPGSSELMKTCQGTFVTAVESGTTVAGQLLFNMILEYTIQFRKMTNQSVAFAGTSTIQAATWTNVSGTWTASTAMSPAAANGDVYVITPALDIPGASTKAWFLKKNPSGNDWTLYESLKDVNNGVFIRDGTTFTTTLVTAYKYVPN